jgi:hypothetical protein
MTRIEKEIDKVAKAATVAHKAGDAAKRNELDRRCNRLIDIAREIFHSREPKQPEFFIQSRRALA